MFIDVQKTLLFYVIIAWSDDFTGEVIDYGAWPDQRRRYFSLADANPTLQSKHPRTGLEGCLYAGLKELTEKMLSREYTRDDGAAMKIERCLIDANLGQSTEVVYQFCRESVFANVILPSHGKYIGASSKPMSEYKKTAGDRVKTEGRGCKVEEWKMRPEAHDNHWFDGVVGNAVAASMCGCVLEGTDQSVQKKPKVKVKLSELRKARGF